MKGKVERLRAELLTIARDVAPAGLVDLIVDWYRAADELGERGIALVEHESAALVAALHHPPDTEGTHARMLVLSEAKLILEPRIARFLHEGGDATRAALEAVRAALEDARAGAGRT